MMLLFFSLNKTELVFKNKFLVSNVRLNLVRLKKQRCCYILKIGSCLNIYKVNTNKKSFNPFIKIISHLNKRYNCYILSYMYNSCFRIKMQKLLFKLKIIYMDYYLHFNWKIKMQSK